MTSYFSTYNYFYNKVYNQAEKSIKNYLKICSCVPRPFLFAHNKIIDRGYKLTEKIRDSYKNDFTSTFMLFNNRSSYYAKNDIKLILNNELKDQFEIDQRISDKSCAYLKFVCDLAQCEALFDAVNIFRNNRSLYSKMYELNNYKHFKLIDVSKSELHLALDKIYYKEIHGEPNKESNWFAVYSETLDPSQTEQKDEIFVKKDSSTPEINFMTIQEVADFLHKAKQTIYGLVIRNEIPFHKKSRRLYFKKEEIIAWVTSDSELRALKKQSATELETQNNITNEVLDSFLLRQKPKRKRSN